MSSAPVWARPPRVPALVPGEAAVWRLGRETPRPLEWVLARYLGTDPGGVFIRRPPLGKPELDGGAFQVSLAHSGDATLVAVAQRDVGVDVEWLRPGAGAWSLVSHALAPGEHPALEGLTEPLRSEVFLAIWSRKEALLKAAGVGLTVDPKLVQLAGCRVVAVPVALGSPEDWTLVDLSLPGHTAALALRGRLTQLSLYDACP